jgi:hypothetical protein
MRCSKSAVLYEHVRREREGMIATVDGKFERIGSVLERAFEAGCEDSGLAARVKEGGQ